MGKLKVNRRPSRSPQIGDLRDRLKLYSRAITPPVFDSADFTQKYTLIDTVWTGIKTIKGPTIFDDVETKKQISIEFTIRYRPDVTTETIAQFDGDNYEIMEPPDQDKRKRFMVLRCSLIGDSTLEVSQ